MKTRRNASTTVAAAAAASRRSARVDWSSSEAGSAGRRRVARACEPTDAGESRRARRGAQLASPAAPVRKNRWTRPTAHSELTPKMVTCPEEPMSMSRLLGKTLRTAPAISPVQEDVVLGGEHERGDAAGGRAVRNRSLALVRGRRPTDARVRQPSAERRRRYPAVEENGANCRRPRLLRAASNCLWRSSRDARGSHWKGWSLQKRAALRPAEKISGGSGGKVTSGSAASRNSGAGSPRRNARAAAATSLCAVKPPESPKSRWISVASSTWTVCGFPSESNADPSTGAARRRFASHASSAAG